MEVAPVLNFALSPAPLVQPEDFFAPSYFEEDQDIMGAATQGLEEDQDLEDSLARMEQEDLEDMYPEQVWQFSEDTVTFF